jgi:1-acyl-sn-glycerol-3-phosphate acyltransferase
MLVLRSLVFNIVFYVNLIVWMLVCIPTLAMPSRAMLRMAQLWAHSSLWLMRVLVGTRVEFRHPERIPAGGLLLTAKHQSLWETFALLTVVREPTFILKRELGWIPLFGWLAIKSGMIPVNRGAGMTALSGMTRRAVAAVKGGRQIIIFPEGTRRAPGDPPDYKVGVAHLYRLLRVPCLPVALNSGLFWGRRQFMRYPGTIVVEFLEPIQPGLSREDFLLRLESDIETAANRLMAQARAAGAGR